MIRLYLSHQMRAAVLLCILMMVTAVIALGQTTKTNQRWKPSDAPQVNGPEQDCISAIPICRTSYSQRSSYQGAGSNANEINPRTSCLRTGEKNCVWYTFTVQQSGFLSFVITPFNLSEDYDWAVYNLTNAKCSDIFSNPSLEVSCNYSATGGQTGPRLPLGSGIVDKDNPVIPVSAGETYVINVSNFSESQNGYSINFSASTAVIFDNVRPTILTVDPLECSATQVTVVFSENVRCSSVELSDFEIVGPSGAIALESVFATNCTPSDQSYDRTFTIRLQRPVDQSGTYRFRLVGPVEDLCINQSVNQEKAFVASGASVTTQDVQICRGANGILTVTSSPVAGARYNWRPLQSVNGIQGTSEGYSVTVRHAAVGSYRYSVEITLEDGCTGYDTATVTIVESPTVSITGANRICERQEVVRQVTVTPSSVQSVSWSARREGQEVANGSSIPVAFVPSRPGQYSIRVEVTSANGCMGESTETIDVLEAPRVNAGNNAVIVCLDSNIIELGSTTGNNPSSVTGGTPPYRFAWRTIAGNDAAIETPNQQTTRARPTSRTSYILRVTDANGCIGEDTVEVDVRLIPDANAGADVAECACDQAGKSIGVPARCGIGPFEYQWSPAQGLADASAVPTVARPSATTTYVLTVRDLGTGESRSDTVVYALRPCPVIQVSSPVILCPPDSTANISAAVSNVDGEKVVFDWAPREFVDDATSASPRVTLPNDVNEVTLRVSASTSFGCTGQGTVQVRRSPVMDITIQSNTKSCLCRGDVARLTASVTGGVPPLSYSWTPLVALGTPDAAETDASPLETTEYTVRVTDALGCVQEQSFRVCVESVPNARPGEPAVICVGESVVRGSDAFCGLAPFTYQWSPLDGVENPNASTTTLRPERTTTYTLLVTDAGGATNSATVSITVNEAPAVSVTQDRTTYCSGSLASLTAEADENATVRWFINDEEQGSDRTLKVSVGDQPVRIRCVVTSAEGCTGTVERTIVPTVGPTVAVMSDKTCACGEVTLTATIEGASAPFQVEWLDAEGQPLRGETLPGNQQHRLTIDAPLTALCRVTDAAGCQVVRSVFIGTPDDATEIELGVPAIDIPATATSVAVPILILRTTANPECPPTDVRFTVTYDASVFDPRPTLSRGSIVANNRRDRQRQVAVEIPFQPGSRIAAGDTLVVMRGAPLLGGDGSTTIQVSDVAWGCLPATTKTVDGNMRLTDLCADSSGNTRRLVFESDVIQSILPNPTSNNAIAYCRLQGHGQLRVISTDGRVVWSTEIVGPKAPAVVEVQLPTAELPAGLYTIRLDTGTSVHHVSLVVLP